MDKEQVLSLDGPHSERASSNVNCLIKCELNDEFYSTIIGPYVLCSFNKLIKPSSSAEMFKN